jgi:hypothetical protein
VWLDALNETQLIDLLNQIWFSAYNQSRTDRQGWFDAIDIVTRQLWDSLMGQLLQQLQEKGIDRITLIPTGYLSFLPLHAAWTEDPSKPTGRRYALRRPPHHLRPQRQIPHCCPGHCRSRPD